MSLQSTLYEFLLEHLADITGPAQYPSPLLPYSAMYWAWSNPIMIILWSIFPASLAIKGGHVTQFWPIKHEQIDCRRQGWKTFAFHSLFSLEHRYDGWSCGGHLAAMREKPGKLQKSWLWHPWPTEPKPAVDILQTSCFVWEIKPLFKPFWLAFLLLIAEAECLPEAQHFTNLVIYFVAHLLPLLDSSVRAGIVP